MAALIVIIIFVLIGLIVLVVGAPLRRAAFARATGAGVPGAEPAADVPLRRADLEAAREAKYREIRDAEMDFRTGKLSESDHRVLDAELRAEALSILDALDALAAEEEPAA